MIYPIISLNGSNGTVLKEDLIVAIRAITAAKTSLNNCAPHGRDYRSDDYTLARQEHCSRINILICIEDELTKIALSIQKQIDK